MISVVSCRNRTSWVIQLLWSFLFYVNASCMYHPFHKTLPRSSVFIKWISVRFYETDCIIRSMICIFIEFLLFRNIQQNKWCQTSLTYGPTTEKSHK